MDLSWLVFLGKEFREAKEEDTEMKDDERQAWRNVKMGIDTFEEDGKRKSTSRGTLSGSSGEDKEEGSRSVSQSGRRFHHQQ